MALVETDSLAVRLGRDFLPAELPRAQAILDDVSAIALGVTEAEWTAEDVPPDVAAVILAAGLRLFKNPDRYIAQSIGDFSATLDRSEVSAGVFTKAEHDVLKRNSQSSGFGVFGFTTVSRYRDEPDRQVEYWATNMPDGTPYSYAPYLQRW